MRRTFALIDNSCIERHSTCIFNYNYYYHYHYYFGIFCMNTDRNDLNNLNVHFMPSTKVALQQ